MEGELGEFSRLSHYNLSLTAPIAIINSDGCGNIEDITGKIAIIARGVCSFMQKVNIEFSQNN